MPQIQRGRAATKNFQVTLRENLVACGGSLEAEGNQKRKTRSIGVFVISARSRANTSDDLRVAERSLLRSGHQELHGRKPRAHLTNPSLFGLTQLPAGNGISDHFQVTSEV